MIYRAPAIESAYSTPVANSISGRKRNYTSKILKSKFALGRAGIRVNGQSGGVYRSAASFTKIGECKQLTAPVTPVELDPHANRPPVIAVGQKTDLARPQRRLQLVLGLQIRVRVTLYYLKAQRSAGSNTGQFQFSVRHGV